QTFADFSAGETANHQNCDHDGDLALDIASEGKASEQRDENDVDWDRDDPDSQIDDLPPALRPPPGVQHVLRSRDGDALLHGLLQIFPSSNSVKALLSRSHYQSWILLRLISGRRSSVSRSLFVGSSKRIVARLMKRPSKVFCRSIFLSLRSGSNVAIILIALFIPWRVMIPVRE